MKTCKECKHWDPLWPGYSEGTCGNPQTLKMAGDGYLETSSDFACNQFESKDPDDEE